MTPAGRRQRHLAARGEEPGRRRLRGPQVVVEHPAPRGVALGLAVGAGRQLGRVGAQQVVAAEPARRVLGQQRGAGQLGQRGPRLRQRAAPIRLAAAGGGDVRTRVQAEQPEHPRRRAR